MLRWFRFGMQEIPSVESGGVQDDIGGPPGMIEFAV
jgi:hypothetical protein